VTISHFMIGILLLVCTVLPLAFAWRLWRLDEPTRGGWLVVVADTLVFTLLILLVGRWDIAGIWTRFLLIGLILCAILLSARRHLGRPWRDPVGSPFWRHHMTTIASLTLFSLALVYILVGLFHRDSPRNLAFPIADGRFVVAHGGGIGLLNHHSSHRAQRYALDIGAVGPIGFRAAGLLPSDPAGYAVFGKTVISPCAGQAVSVTDELPDMRPPVTDPEHPPGNHVVLACDGLRVELAHFRRGSVAVAAGDRVAVGQPLGQVGNSGNSTEPHLHIHAVDPRTGAGAQIAFDGVIPTRNAVFVR
jgi:hypothetical protein